MAMVKISNGEITQIVSNGAYESQYKKLGFYIVGNNYKNVEDKTLEHNDVVNKNISNDIDYGANNDNSDDFEDLLEKPLSQWTNEELKLFVNSKGIDTTSAKKTSEVRALVKKYLDYEAKKASEV